MFDRAVVTQQARDVGLVERAGGKVQPFDLLLSLLGALCVGPARSIAAVRREWEHLTGATIARGAFDAHFDKPALVAWTWQRLAEALACSRRAQRRRWPAPLRDLFDVVIEDGTRMTVGARLAAVARGTTPGQAALKLLARMSLGAGQLTDARLGAAVHHDRRLLRATAPTPGALYLRDLGFYDHGAFAALADADAWFVSRLKDSAMPTVAAVVCGVTGGAGPVVGAPLDDFLTYGPVVDLDARFRVAGAPARVFRVVQLAVPVTDRHDRPTGATRACWFVTNLPRDAWSPAAIAALYRLRWAVERLFRSSKHLARLDHLASARLTVLYTFIAASLLLQALADRLTGALATGRGPGAVSPDLVLATLVHGWRALVAWLRPSNSDDPLIALARILTHDSRHPNPSQPRRVATVFEVLATEARTLAQAR